jgi:hypothetical protein
MFALIEGIRAARSAQLARSPERVHPVDERAWHWGMVLKRL